MFKLIIKQYTAKIKLKIQAVPAMFTIIITTIDTNQNIYPAVVDHCGALRLVNIENAVISKPMTSKMLPITGSGIGTVQTPHEL